MKGIMGLIFMVLGIVVAASFGSRNGDRHVEYRQAGAKVAAGQHMMDVIDEGRELNETLRAEGIKLDEMSMEQHLELIQNDSRLSDQIEKTNKALDDLRKWGLGEQNPRDFLHIAQREQARIGLPGPQERLGSWFDVGGVGWLVGLVLIVGGALLARLQQREDNAGGPQGSTGRVDFEQTLRETLRRVAQIRDTIADLPMDDDAPKARLALDSIANDVLLPMVDGRGQLIARHGLAGFAEYFGPFSAGERNLNRAWSALTDGHAVVARDALVSAEAAFEAALTSYEGVEGRG